MALEELLALAAGRESETLEFKRTTGTRREAAATVCAMLNHRGGHVRSVLRRKAMSSASMWATARWSR